MELLLEHNAHIDAVNKVIWTLGKAPVPQPCLTFLCYSNGSDVYFQLGQTPLAQAVYMHREEIVELLLQKGADVNTRLKSER